MATSTVSYGVDGECGWQHNNAHCIPEAAPVCCGKNGFCGYNATYCLVEYGCQSDCRNSSDFASTTTTATLTSSSSTLATAKMTGTSPPSSTASASPSSTSGLAKGTLIGIIVGSVGGVSIVILVGILLYKHFRPPRQPDPSPDNSQEEMTRYNGEFAHNPII